MLLPPRSPGPTSPAWACREKERVVNALLQREQLLAVAKNWKSPPKPCRHATEVLLGFFKWARSHGKTLCDTWDAIKPFFYASKASTSACPYLSVQLPANFGEQPGSRKPSVLVPSDHQQRHIYIRGLKAGERNNLFHFIFTPATSC